MFSIVSKWLDKRIIRQSTIPDSAWLKVYSQLPLLNRLTAIEKGKLRHLAILFLHKKSFEGAQGFRLSNEMNMLIALQACLPILHLGIDWYRGWVSIIVYPDSFVPQRTYTDENGVVHHSNTVLGGESWLRGPVILSWQGVASSPPLDGNNLVIHEFVHKLDMLNGVANGFPPLHKGMNATLWADDFGKAFEDLQYRINAGESTVIDHYAATEPAEFFAVFCEVFFERPEHIHAVYPQVYQHLADFFRQDPLSDIGSQV